MPFWGTTRDEAVDDFEEYDPKPYSGGYDISLTYGRPLPPSEDTCHPLSSFERVDNERPTHSSEFDMSAFEAEYGRKGDCYGLLPPGFDPPPETNTNYPNYGYVKSGEYASEYGSSYGGRTQPQEYGSGYDGPQEYRSEYSSGRKPQHGSGYGRQEESYGYGGSGYGRSEVGGYARQGYEVTEPIYYGGESGEGHGSPNYGVDSEAEKKKHHQHRHHQHHHRHHGDD